MRIWLISCGLLFSIVELYQWFAALSVPMPVYLACGVALAIASNASKNRSPQKGDAVKAEVNLPARDRAPASLTSGPVSFKIDPPVWKQRENE